MVGSSDGVGLPLAPGVRSGPVGSADAVGADVGTAPSPPVPRLDPATSAGAATMASDRGTGPLGVMSQAPGGWLSVCPATPPSVAVAPQARDDPVRRSL